LSCVDIDLEKQFPHGTIVMLAAGSAFRLAASNRAVKAVHFHFAIKPYGKVAIVISWPLLILPEYNFCWQ